jgi:hypothetical protein
LKPKGGRQELNLGFRVYLTHSESKSYQIEVPINPVHQELSNGISCDDDDDDDDS